MNKRFLSLFIGLIISNTVLAEASWSYGGIELTESFSDYVVIRWDGPLTQDCGGTTNAVRFDADTLGGEEAFNRALSIALTAQVSQKKIRFHLDGCDGTKQKATVVQLCTNNDCSYT